MTDVLTSFVTAQDGTRLAVHQTGAEDARPLLLLHGYFSDAEVNWIKYGHAATLAEAGFRVLMPDLRAHGQSDKPHDPGMYPPDILASDGFAVLEHFGVRDYDLAGYSLGGRTAARMLAGGSKPGRAAICGMGLQGLTDTGARAVHFRNVFANLGNHPKGSAAFMAEAFLKTTGGDPVALERLLDSFVDTPIEVIRSIEIPAAVICGDQDDDNGSAEALADALPHGSYHPVPGNHMSAVTKPALGQVIADFLSA